MSVKPRSCSSDPQGRGRPPHGEHGEPSAVTDGEIGNDPDQDSRGDEAREDPRPTRAPHHNSCPGFLRSASQVAEEVQEPAAEVPDAEAAVEPSWDRSVDAPGTPDADKIKN